MKRKPTTKDRLHEVVRRADEADARNRQVAANQIQTINRMLLLLRATQTFLESIDATKDWEIYLAHVTADACYICGDKMNHYGVPHSEATGDGKTRADVAADKAKADLVATGVNEDDAERAVDAALAAYAAPTEPEPVGSGERDAEPETPTPPTAT